ncbi:DUF3169 family protein [uncultured Subdoligranulum sp.]|uniref:DUF3169 family protein n=1 Tax=uncultured Subdoligranulum sp. TaxID=512298 RepID=UPI002602FE84|nr:DUF3169 family protein [uncultured Subdoligranulum sp.]
MKPMDKQDKIKQENRSKLPAFLLLVALGAAAGAVIAISSNWLAAVVSPWELTRVATLALSIALPFVALLCVPFLIAAMWCLRKSQTLFARWDGDDERLPEQIERRLEWALLWVSTTQFLVLLSLGLCLSLLPLGAIGTSVALVVPISCAVMMFLSIQLQRRVVDLTRRMNPEKQGSVYDVKFRKKWYSSCDEAERQRIGEAAYAAHIATTYTSLALWVVMVLLNIFIPVGPLPVLAALVPWGAGQLTYLLHCIHADK